MNEHATEHMHGGSTGHHPSSSPDGCDEAAPTCGGHNQMMVGEQTIYLSHLPMFMFDPERHEHNFQVILEVTLSGTGNPQAVYANDRRKHRDVRMYTMQPDPFEMVELDPKNPERTALTGKIWRGHLERPGRQPIIERATAHVERIVYFNKFDPNARPLDQLEYLLFGKAPDVFLAHIITRPPDFDQILGVKVTAGTVSEEDLRRGIRLRIPGRKNDLHTRVRAGERTVGQVLLEGGQTGKPTELQLEATTEFYFEEGELRAPPLRNEDFDPTPEEMKAGF